MDLKVDRRSTASTIQSSLKSSLVFRLLLNELANEETLFCLYPIQNLFAEWSGE